MSKKLAVTFSGAVSLGSYEAGVLYEVLYALKQHNQQPGVPDAAKIYIDVLTGASAGGLSVSLAAQTMLYDADSLDQPYNNPLYNAWVKDIDIERLLTLAQDESPTRSILSSDLIDKLANRYLLGRYGSGHPPAPKSHPAVGPDGTLRLGLALSNLCGVDYTRPTLGSGSFTYTRFQDQLTKTLGSAEDSLAHWEPIQKAAVSCGAFPFAFRVQDLQREIDCYNSSPFFNAACFAGQTARSFTYTDGGLFQNQPLGLAKNLVDTVDNHLNADARAYLFVAPDPQISTADDTFSAEMGDFGKVAVRILLSVFNESRFQDWIQVEEVNQGIAAFNSRAMDLHQLMQSGTLTPESIHPAFTSLLDVTGRDHLYGPDNREGLVAARARLQQQFCGEYLQLREHKGNTAADAWINAVLAFELASGLHDKEEMYIYPMTATVQELAGSPLMWFLGFFNQEYRDHDYDIGRLKAQAFLSNPGTPEGGPLSSIHYVSQPVRPLKPGLTGVSIKQISRNKRIQLRDRLRDRAGIMLKEAGLSFFVRHSIQLLFLNEKINDLLGL